MPISSRNFRGNARLRSSSLLAFFGTVGTFVVSSTAHESDARADDFATLAVEVEPPRSLAYDDTVLGRARHAVHVVVSNKTAQSVALAPVTFRFVAMREGIAYDCKTVEGEPDRWPKTLASGDSVDARRTMICETPLPGTYDVKVYVQPRNGDPDRERVVASFPLEIEKGTNPPVRSPWDKDVWVAASGTRDRRPADPPPRILVALINGANKQTAISSATVTLRVNRRGGTKAPCADIVAPLAFSGTLEAGRSQSLPTVLKCDFSKEGIYEIVVTVESGGGRVKVGTIPIRVAFIPTPIPVEGRGVGIGVGPR
jgi:hypothetical protein